MSFSFIDKINEYITNNFNGQIPNLLYFLIGLAIGLVLFVITVFVLYLISKRKVSNKQRVITPTNIDYIDVVEQTKQEYENNYKDLPIKDKATNIGKLILSMMEKIAKVYYPNSADPLFEISLDQLVDFLQYMVKRINFTIDNVLLNNLTFIDGQTKLSLKDKKISIVFEMINKKKQEQEQIEQKIEENNKKGLFGKIKNVVINTGKNMALKYSSNVIDNEFYTLIEKLGDDINMLYTNQKLEFKDVSDNNVYESKKKKNFISKLLAKKVGGN